MSYFEDQEEAWFDGGREWYQKEEGLSDTEMDTVGIPGDFDPYCFWADTVDEDTEGETLSAIEQENSTAHDYKTND